MPHSKSASSLSKCLILFQTLQILSEIAGTQTDAGFVFSLHIF